MTETAKERIYREALEILRGMGINSKNRVMMPYGVAVTAQEFIEEKLEDTENLPVTTDEKTVEKLHEQLNTAKKALTESEKMYQKQMDRFLNSEMNESARSHCESQLKLLFPAHKAYEVLAAIGGDDD